MAVSHAFEDSRFLIVSGWMRLSQQLHLKAIILFSLWHCNNAKRIKQKCTWRTWSLKSTRHTNCTPELGYHDFIQKLNVVGVVFFFWLSDQLCFQLDADQCSCPFSSGCHQRSVRTFGSASPSRCDPGGCSGSWVPPETPGGPWAPQVSYPAYDEVSLVSLGVVSCGSTTGIYLPVERAYSCSRRHLCVHNSCVEEDMSL